MPIPALLFGWPAVGGSQPQAADRLPG